MNNSTGLVSVIMPTYNHAAYIDSAITSVLNQTYDDLELIIIDNFSKDNTEEIVNRHKENDTRIIYKKFNNQGVIATGRNHGLELAKGEFVAFLDADDLWENDKLEKQVKLFTGNIGFVYTRQKFIDTDDNMLNVTSDPDFYRGKILEKLLQHNFTITSTVMLRKDLLDKYNLNFRTGRQGVEDWDLWLRVAFYTEFDYVDEKLLIRRVHLGSISQNHEMMYNSAMTTFDDIQKDILNVFSENTCLHKYLAALNAGRINQTLTFALKLMKNHDCKKAVEYILKALKMNYFNLSAWKMLIKAILFEKRTAIS